MASGASVLRRSLLSGNVEGKETLGGTQEKNRAAKAKKRGFSKKVVSSVILAEGGALSELEGTRGKTTLLRRSFLSKGTLRIEDEKNFLTQEVSIKGNPFRQGKI